MSEQTVIFRLKAIGDFSDVGKNINEIQQGLNKLKMPAAMKENFSGIFSELTKETQKYQRLLDSGFKKKGDVTGLEASGARISNMLKRLKTEMTKIDPSILEKSFDVKNTAAFKQIAEDMERARQALSQKIDTSQFTNLNNVVTETIGTLSGFSKSKALSEFSKAFASGDIKAAEAALESLYANLNKFKGDNKINFGAGLETLKTQLQELQGIPGLKEIITEIEQLQLKANNIESTEFQNFLQMFGGATGDVSRFRGEFEGLNGQLAEGARRSSEFGSQLDMFKNRVKYFFSLTNGVQLFRRAVTGALNTVKELDATMTEAAVVTDFSVGDMWKKLPQYAAEAQALGVSINGMYQATTLYYQQGLKTDAAMALGVETMKMAKIAGMESTEATQAMTAALRGFNMELNELSATRVNDVYSQLAAVTAADTSQISTAMEKTASIAASANMEFETTAALLAQIIETTQEAPETAGTALKTIIARFSEVKKLREQGLGSGTDEEGEGIDVNKIQTALRTVGISMEGFFAGTEGLDSILLKLAEKWGTLDFETQRYIATMAAGSRQQSRFIAMMSDYGRTQELVGEAQNSAGASQKQFEKTLDSMESKLQKLSNAWNEFLMGLANNEILKGAVDTLTFFIEGINKITDGISGGNGLIKSIVNLTSVIMALRIGGKAANVGMGLLFGSTFGASLKAGTATGAGQPNAVQQVTGPNVQAQADAEGQKAATGFIAGWKRTLTTMRNGGGVGAGLKSFFASEDLKNQRIQQKTELAEVVAGRHLRQKIGKTYRKEGFDTAREDYMERINIRNFKLHKDGGPLLTKKQLGEVSKTFEEAYEKTNDYGAAVNAANEKVRSFGGTLLSAKEKLKLSGQVAKTTGFDFQALGSTIMGVGMLMGGLNMLLSSFEVDTGKLSEVTAGVMGLGMAISAIPMLLKSLTAIASSLAVSLGPVVWVFLAIVAIVAAILVQINYLEKNSPEAKLEEAQKATDAAKEAAEKAKQAYDDLLTGRDEYNELQDKMKGLVRGTDEWREALLEANAQVLDLVDRYPALEKYMTTGAYGQLVIEEGGWEQAIKEAQMAKASTSSMVASGLHSQKKLEKEVALKNRAADSEMSDSEFKELVSAYQKNTEIFDLSNGALEEFAKTSSYSVSELMTFSSEIASCAAELSALEVAADSYAQTAIKNKISDESAAYEYSDAITKGVSEVYGGYGVDEEIYNEIEGDSGNDIKDKMSEEDMARYGIDKNLLTGDDVKDTKTIYMKMTGITDENDIPGYLKDNEQGQLVEISKILAADRSADTANKIINNLKTLDKDTQRKYSALFSKDVGMASFADKGVVAKGISLDTMASQMGIERTELMRMMGAASAEELEEIFKNYDEQAKKAYEEIFKGNDTMGLQASYDKDPKTGLNLKGILDDLSNTLVQLGSNVGLTIDQADRLAKSFAQVKLNGGDVTALSGQFSRLLSGLSGAALDSGIELLANVDWDSKDSIDEALSGLRALGVTIDSSLTESIYKAAAAVRKFNLKKLETELQKLKDLSKSVQEKVDEENSTYTREERDALIEAGISASSFVAIDLGEYVFMGETEAILSSIEGLTESILHEMIGDAETSNATGVKYSNFLNKDGDKKNKFADETMANKYYEESFTVDYDDNGNPITITGQTLLDGFANGTYTFDPSSTLGTYIDDITARRFIYGMIYGTAAPGDDTKDEYWQDKENELRGAYNSQNPLDIEDRLYVNNSKYGNTGTYEYEGEDGVKRTISGASLLQQMAEGKIDWKGTGSDKKGGVTRETMLELLSAIYGPEIAEAMIEGKTDGEVYALLTAGYNDYKNLDKTQSEVNSVKYEAATSRGYKKAGTQEYMDHYYTTDEDGNTVLTEAGQQREKIRNLGFFGDETAEEFITRIASGNYDATKDEGLMRYMANSLGVEGTEDMDAAQLAGALGDIHGNALAPEQGLDAYIQQNEGLSTLISTILKKEGELWKGREEELKNAVVGAHKATKAWKKLGEVIKDNYAALKSDDPFEKAAAMEKIVKQGKEVFGDWFDADVVENMLEKSPQLFEDLANGVEGAEEQFKELAGEEYLATVDVNVDKESLKAAEGEVLQELDGKPIGTPVTLTGLDIAAEAHDAFIEYMATKGITMTVASDGEGGFTWTATATGGGGFGGGGGGGGGGNEYENPYDKLHNDLERINSLLRERERLERRYQRLLDSSVASMEELTKNHQQTVENLQQELALQQHIREQRILQIQQEISENPDLEKYVRVITDEFGDLTLDIDWAGIDALAGQSGDTGEKIDEFYDKIQGWLESIYEIDTNVEDAADALLEEMKKGQDEYLDFEDQTKEALEKYYQDQIDMLSEVNDSINDTNSRILESMQEQLDQQRQERDNAKTEEELSDKQRRLAYLQQDTSGANALEILQLQKEIEEGQESYTDQLIDQKISELQKQNDEAAEQRERQIELAQAQLDQYVESGAIWAEVETIMAEGVDETGKLVEGSFLSNILKEANDYESLSKIGQMDWLNETNKMIAQGLVWRNDNKKIMASLFGGQEIEFTTADGQTLKGKVQNNGTVITDDGSIYSGVTWDGGSGFSTTENYQTPAPEEEEEEEITGSGNLASLPGNVNLTSEQIVSLQKGLNELLEHGKLSGFSKLEIDGIYGNATSAAVMKLQAAIGESPADGIWGPSTKKKLSESALKTYHTGGLADFTGPAWLDGTKSKPEYILNADQTKAFFTLVDVLSGLQMGNTKPSENSGDNTFDIDINVESIGSDYDVEQIAEKVKNLINESARYRNNTTAGTMR